jgi:hypothetical protein
MRQARVVFDAFLMYVCPLLPVTVATYQRHEGIVNGMMHREWFREANPILNLS